MVHLPNQSAFDPSSPQARLVAHLWWWMLGGGALVWLLVMVAIGYAILVKHPTASGAAAEPPPHRDTQARWLVTGATVTTAIILFSFLVADFVTDHALAEHPANALHLEVTGHQWWWEIKYDKANEASGVTTANEIHVPVGVPVEITLHAADVIHSFWVPSLGGKHDLIPGYTSTVWLRADTAGVYRGQCAEFCGLEHAKMALYVIAQPRDQFAAWARAQLAEAAPPADSLRAEGERIFLSGSCALCHTVRGTSAGGSVGPDLTHVADRHTLAAGSVANTLDNLEGWITNPGTIKPGVNMPPSPSLSGAQLNALALYVAGLK